MFLTLSTVPRTARWTKRTLYAGSSCDIPQPFTGVVEDLGLGVLLDDLGRSLDRLLDR